MGMNLLLALEKYASCQRDASVHHALAGAIHTLFHLYRVDIGYILLYCMIYRNHYMHICLSQSPNFCRPL